MNEHEYEEQGEPVHDQRAMDARLAGRRGLTSSHHSTGFRASRRKCLTEFLDTLPAAVGRTDPVRETIQSGCYG